ncbi:MAG: hypothetical protein ACLUTU_09850 [Blautia faecis]
MKQIKEILIASVSLFLLGFGICMAVSTFFMYREGEQESRGPAGAISK